MTGRLARACARRPWLTVGAWAFILASSLAAVGVLLTGSLTTDARVTNDPESLRGYDLIGQRGAYSPESGLSEILVVRSDAATVDDARFRGRVQALLAASKNLIRDATDYYETRDRSLVSADRHALLVPFGPAAPVERSIEGLVEMVRNEQGAGGFALALSGPETRDHDVNGLSESDLRDGELRIGLPAALVVLVAVFGTMVAVALPLVVAVVAIIAALGLTALVAAQFELSVFVVNMLTGMGLALGIDYVLFILSRYREERHGGLELEAAIERAGATASRAVLFSGSAFIFAMLGLLLVQSTIMRSLAAGAILVGITTVAAALTLLPALLSILGDRVDRWRVPFVGGGGEREGRFWGRVVALVLRRPAVSLASALCVLLAAAAPILGMHIGATGVSALPDTAAAKQGVLALERSFPAAGAEPAIVVVDGNADDAPVRRAVSRLRERLAQDGDFGAVSQRTSGGRDLIVLEAQMAADPLSDRAVEGVRRLRDGHVPEAFDGVDARVLVTGITAENVDYFAVMRHWLPLVIAFVLTLTFCLLTVAFRSVVVAAKAILVNLLSVAAAYGLVVTVFVHGHGAGLLGFQKVGLVEAWVPLFMFAVLFGLSMDYQVFLLSRIRERYAIDRDNRAAVTFGITSTARIITGAALIIVAVFAGFAAGELVMFQQMGFGVAVALLIDATIVRSVVVPSAMVLLGDRNWYLPGWLEWLPRLEVEK